MGKLPTFFHNNTLIKKRQEFFLRGRDACLPVGRGVFHQPAIPFLQALLRRQHALLPLR